MSAFWFRPGRRIGMWARPRYGPVAMANFAWPSANLVPPGNGLAGDTQLLADLPAEFYSLPARMDSRLPWSPNGRHLLYVGPEQPPTTGGPLMLLDLSQPTRPRPISPGIIGNAAWHPSGQSFAFTTARLVPAEGFRTTIYQMGTGADRPTELVTTGVGPGTEAVLQRWLDDQTLAFDQNLGTGLRRLMLFDTKRGEASDPSLGATDYRWEPIGEQVAGQLFIWPAPPYFWLWNRRTGKFVFQPNRAQGRLPGSSQFFEAWSPAGRYVLFTAWDRFAYAPDATPTLYRLDLETGQVTKVADNAAFAAWSGDWITYVAVGPRLTLTVTRARDNQVLWSDDLGVRPTENGDSPWVFRPLFADPYLIYRTVGNEWRVARADDGAKRTFYRGDPGHLSISPDGRHIALIHQNQAPRLLVIRNPLIPQ